MILYYIDDSMFQKSVFASQIFFRFERYLQKNTCDLIVISTTDEHHVEVDHIKSMMKDAIVLMSPALFDVGGVRGNLHTTFLAIEDFPVMQSYSGSFVKYNTESKECHRIYLEMFIEHDPELDWIVAEMEQMLTEKITKMKKKTTLS